MGGLRLREQVLWCQELGVSHVMTAAFSTGVCFPQIPRACSLSLTICIQGPSCGQQHSPAPSSLQAAGPLPSQAEKELKPGSGLGPEP